MAVTSSEAVCNRIVFIFTLILVGQIEYSYGKRKPNIVLFLSDDLGYGDLSSYGHPTQEPGAVDKMAREGLKFTQMYASESMCTPSRAALLTGRLPIRYGMIGDRRVLFNSHQGGLPHAEITLAEALQPAGYTTGIVGKWHLGINEFTHDDGRFLPHTQGFDYVGTILPWTLTFNCDDMKRHLKEPIRMLCILYENTTIVQQPIKLAELTHRIVYDAVSFINQHAHEPFFLFVSLPQVHTPMFNHPHFRNKSKRGIFGDQVNEMNWAVGQILDTLKEHKLEEDTLAVFTSDHGNHREMCEEAGSPSMFKGGKCNFYEGGLRVPAIAWWPGTIPAGSHTTQVASLMDLFPTFLEIAGATLPMDRQYDGESITKLLFTKPEIEANRILYFYCSQYLMAVRYGSYKVHFRRFDIASDEEISSRWCDQGFPLYNYFEHGFCEKSYPLEQVEVYNIDHDPEERYKLNNKLYYNTISVVEDAVKVHKTSLPSTPKFIVSSESTASRLQPCCNPPYCICNKPFF